MTVSVLLAAVCTGGGGWCVAAVVAGLRRPILADRIAPYLTGIEDRAPRGRPAGLVAAAEPTVAGVVRRGQRDMAARLDRLLGGSESVERRLDALGRGTVAGFRADQVLWAAVGGGIGLLLLTVRLVTDSGLPPLSLAGLVLTGIVGGVIGRDQLLTRAVRVRDERMVEQLPAVADLMALAVGAGESPLAALDRVSRTAPGELAGELRRVLTDVRAGASVPAALRALAQRSSLPPLARFADGIVVALQRGTPLADLLRAQAGDVREDTRRRLMELGGRREVAMMAPVVFLILPVTLLFALFPALVTLSTLTH